MDLKMPVCEHKLLSFFASKHCFRSYSFIFVLISRWVDSYGNLHGRVEGKNDSVEALLMSSLMHITLGLQFHLNMDSEEEEPRQRPHPSLLLTCPSQVGKAECGYFVINYIKEIIDEPNCSIINTVSANVI